MSDSRQILDCLSTEYTTPLEPLKIFDFSKFWPQLEFLAQMENVIYLENYNRQSDFGHIG